jgi:hypothetical protein
MLGIKISTGNKIAPNKKAIKRLKKIDLSRVEIF